MPLRALASPLYYSHPPPLPPLPLSGAAPVAPGPAELLQRLAPPAILIFPSLLRTVEPILPFL